MITLILGGSGSGKSAFAENYVCEHFDKDKKIYLATMQIFDSEGEKKVDRHRQMRAGKGFLTMEIPFGITDSQISGLKDQVLLLECMSNLTANLMFQDCHLEEKYRNMTDEERQEWKQDLVEKIGMEITKISNNCKHLVIVSNNVFEDGITYDLLTESYIEILGRVNQQLAKISDEVYEVIVSIPVKIKEVIK